MKMYTMASKADLIELAKMKEKPRKMLENSTHVWLTSTCQHPEQVCATSSEGKGDMHACRMNDLYDIYPPAQIWIMALGDWQNNNYSA